jgi:hypothetical protein
VKKYLITEAMKQDIERGVARYPTLLMELRTLEPDTTIERLDALTAEFNRAVISWKANEELDRQTIERLEAERDAAFAMSRCQCGTDEACANLARVNAENAALKADALRYRWLQEVGDDEWDAVCYESKEWQNAYIDAAIKGEKP